MIYLVIYSVIITLAFVSMWAKRDYMHKVIGDFTYMLNETGIMDKKDQEDWFYQNGHHGFTWKSSIWDKDR